jgi:hypothetical protein
VKNTKIRKELCVHSPAVNAVVACRDAIATCDAKVRPANAVTTGPHQSSFFLADARNKVAVVVVEQRVICVVAGWNPSMASAESANRVNLILAI